MEFKFVAMKPGIVICSFFVWMLSCQSNNEILNSETVQMDTNAVSIQDSIAVILNDSVVDGDQKISGLNQYYLRFAFNDSLRSNYEFALLFLDDNSISFEEYYENDMSENVILFSLKDSSQNEAQFMFQYTDDEEGNFSRYSHEFNFDGQSGVNAFREFVFDDLKIRFGNEYNENNSVNCSNYEWPYKANLNYNCKSWPNSVSISL